MYLLKGPGLPQAIEMDIVKLETFLVEQGFTPEVLRCLWLILAEMGDDADTLYEQTDGIVAAVLVDVDTSEAGLQQLQARLLRVIKAQLYETVATAQGFTGDAEAEMCLRKWGTLTDASYPYPDDAAEGKDIQVWDQFVSALPLQFISTNLN